MDESEPTRWRNTRNRRKLKRWRWRAIRMARSLVDASQRTVRVSWVSLHGAQGLLKRQGCLSGGPAARLRDGCGPLRVVCGASAGIFGTSGVHLQPAVQPILVPTSFGPDDRVG